MPPEEGRGWRGTERASERGRGSNAISTTFWSLCKAWNTFWLYLNLFHSRMRNQRCVKSQMESDKFIATVFMSQRNIKA